MPLPIVDMANNKSGNQGSTAPLTHTAVIPAYELDALTKCNETNNVNNTIYKQQKKSRNENPANLKHIPLIT